MAWLESHGNLARHPKTRRLMQRMGWTLPCTIGNLHLLWHWALEFAPTGDLTRFEPEHLTYDLDLGDATPEEFIEAMVEAGFIDRLSADSVDSGSAGESDPPESRFGRRSTLRLHDWPEYTAKSLRPKFRHDPERWHQVLRSYGLPIIIRQKPPVSKPVRDSALAPEQIASSRASSEPILVVAPRRDTADPDIAQTSSDSPIGEHAIPHAASHHRDDGPAQGSKSNAAGNHTSNNADAPPIKIPKSLAGQPGFTNTWWPKFIEMYKLKGSPLSDFEQRKVLERLERLNGKPHTALQLVKTAVTDYEVSTSASLAATGQHFANST